MDFIDQIKQFSKRVSELKDVLNTEEATKTALIMPFFSILGYDVFNPNEFVPEYVADVGIKKGEKVDYAIIQDGIPTILIEAKWCGEDLQKHGSQLFRYFGTTNSKFGILTNGIIYNFYTDLDEPNKMDEKPFFSIDLLHLRDNQIPALKKFTKSSFNSDSVVNTAFELKYLNEFKAIFAQQLQNPDDEFVRLFLNLFNFKSPKTKNVIDNFRPILKRALNSYITELMNDKIKSALDKDEERNADEETIISNGSPANENKREIVTTPEELESYFIVKSILKNDVDMNDIFYRDALSYFAILYKNNNRMPICRVQIKEKVKYVWIPNQNKKMDRYKIENVYDIENLKDKLIAIARIYAQK